MQPLLEDIENKKDKSLISSRLNGLSFLSFLSLKPNYALDSIVFIVLILVLGLWAALAGDAPVAGGGTHREGEGATRDNVAVVDVALVVGLAVEGGALDVDVLVAVVQGLDGEGLAVAYIDAGLVEQR